MLEQTVLLRAIRHDVARKCWIAPGSGRFEEAEKMPKSRKRPGGASRFAINDWLLFDASELSWIALAVGGVLSFAYLTGG